MAKYIPIHPNDDTFKRLMKGVANALRTGNAKLLESVKKEFAESYIDLFYKKESDIVRLVRKDSPPIDFPVSRWTSLPIKK